MKNSIITVWLTAVLCIGVGAWGQASTNQLSDEKLTPIMKGFDARRDEILALQIRKPFPDPVCAGAKPTDNGCIWGKLDFGLAALYQNTDLEAANKSIRDGVQILSQRVSQSQAAAPGVASEGDPTDFHFASPMLLLRIYELFWYGEEVNHRRLEAGTAKAIESVFWQYAHIQCAIADAGLTNVWRIWGSENHGAMKNGACWSAALILADVPAYAKLPYADKSTAAGQLKAWSEFQQAYIQQRASRGMLAEIFSPTYTSYILENFYNYYDFSANPKLKTLSRNFLDLWWADWAEEQIDGVHGGSKARFYQSKSATATPLMGLAWLYLAIGTREGLQAPPVMNMLTSGYRMPLVVMDIALDREGRGTYAAESQRIGLALRPTDGSWYTLNPDGGGIYRYTYCTPAFIMGASMFAKLPDASWTAISSQNRWDGLILNAGPGARIFAIPAAPIRDRAYNQFWSVQNKATQIVQKLSEPWSKNTGRMHVWIPQELPRVESGGWVFIDSAAFVAVRPAIGSYKWDKADPNWLVPENDLSPVIIQAAQKSDFESFEAFQQKVKSLPLSAGRGKLEFKGLAGAGTLTFYTESNQLPEIDGVPINVKPAFAFQSPFLREAWATGLVIITKGDRKLVLNFKDSSRS